MSTYHYVAFGLRLASALELPELVARDSGGDVTIEFGDVPETLEAPTERGALYQVAPEQFLLTIPDTARYLVAEGKRIVIQPAPHASDAAVHLYLLGSVFGALLHQRGALPIHGSAIATPRGAVTFSGPSGCGKSTLAWAFHQRGYRHLCDDVSVVGFDAQGKPLVYPAYPQASIWADVLEKTGLGHDALRAVHPELQKYALSTRARFDAAPVPLVAMYVLQTTHSDTFELIPLCGVDKLQILVANTYRPRFVSAMGKRAEHFKRAATAGRFLRACRVVRPETPFQLDALVDLLEKDWAA